MAADGFEQRVWDMPCAGLIGAIRHHAHFLEDDAARSRLSRFRARIDERGARAFLDEEYPAASGKAFIVNEAAGQACLVDGNAHLLAILSCEPDLTLGGLAQAAGRADIVRIWHEGWEEGSGQDAPYDVYIPHAADASRIPGAREGMDGFKNPPIPVNVIPASVAFSSPLFAARDRGRALGETLAALQEEGVL